MRRLRAVDHLCTKHSRPSSQVLEQRIYCKSLGCHSKKGKGEERAYKKSLPLGVTLYKKWGVSTQMDVGVVTCWTHARSTR